MTTLTIRVDESTKKEASKVFESSGMNLSTAINMFLRQAIIKQRFPCSIESEISCDYSFSYPKGFFDLFCKGNNGIEEPDDILLTSENLGI